MDKKKLIYSIAAIVIIGGLAGAGTYAFFTATRTTNANQFTTGTLDLNVASGGVANAPIVVENTGATGLISGEKSWVVTNTGSLPGRFLVRLQNLINNENGCNDQEASAESTCADDNNGELGGKLNLTLFVDGVQVAASDLATANMTSVGSQWASSSSIIIPAGESVTLKATWVADENSYGNEIQSDSTQFDINTRLIQNIAGEAPSNL